MNLLEKIKQKYNLAEYISETTGLKWTSVGTWQDLENCPFCSGKDCFRLAPTGTVFCFQCSAYFHDVIKFRAVLENITYKESLDKFKDELGIKKYESDTEWCLIRESAGEYLTNCLLNCHTKYNFGEQTITPLEYLTNIRKHTIDSVLHFRLGFNDGGLLDNLKQQYSEAVLKSAEMTTIPENVFLYPIIVEDKISYFRFKDPNKIVDFQMPNEARGPNEKRRQNTLFYNQDILKDTKEMILVEGEDDVISLWDAGQNAVATCGQLQQNHVKFLQKYPFNVIYLCFDNDPPGKNYTEVFVRIYQNSNVYIMLLPEGIKDIDDVLRESEDVSKTIEELKHSAIIPQPELRSIIRQKQDGYYTLRKEEHRLTNWTLFIEAIICSESEQKMTWKGTLKWNNSEKAVVIETSAFSNIMRLREFILSEGSFLYFNGNDRDLSELVKYFSLAFQPKKVTEIENIGQTKYGFIAENVFISNADEIKPLTNSFLQLDEKNSIKIISLVQKGGIASELPYFELSEPLGGIRKFKNTVYDLMINNRNLKPTIAVGWMKAVIWSDLFYNQRRFFPLLVLHGKKESGKTVLTDWLLSMVGLRTVKANNLREGGSTNVGLARKLAYYSNLPVVANDYRADDVGFRFHSLMRNVYDRTVDAKGIKDDFGIREVNIRGCLLVNGEHMPPDPGLQSRMIALELTSGERKDNFYKNIVKLEPKFSCIGFDWVKRKNADFSVFMQLFEKYEGLLLKELDSPRQASCYAVALAGIMTEGTFIEAELLEYTIKLATFEKEERKQQEIMNTLWDAVGILHSHNELKPQAFFFDIFNNKELSINLSVLLSQIKGYQYTKHYDLPNQREVAKLLRQEPYFQNHIIKRVDGKRSWRWFLDYQTCPEVVKNILDLDEKDENNAVI